MPQSVVLIPAYQPDNTLLDVVTGILAKGLDSPKDFEVIVVNDGSSSSSSRIFETLRKMDRVTVVEHPVNRGKGAALKTGMHKALLLFPEIQSVITADADGQHAPDDIIGVMERVQSEGLPVLGVREFDGEIPFRSRFGNTVTRKLFSLIFRIKISDTQTGLRGIPSHMIPELLKISADRYNYEFEALIRCARHGQIVQMPIKTIYEPGNPTSHFNPLLDSVRIYAVFLRHIAVVFGIAIVDYIIFLVMLSAGAGALYSLVAARTVSLVIYFVAAKKVVFRSNGNAVREATLFLLLVFGNVLLLWPLIEFFNSVGGIRYAFAMPLANILLFGSNFLWQNYVVFRERDA